MNTHHSAAHELLLCMNIDETMMQTVDGMLELELQSNPQLIIYKDTMREFFTKHMTGQAMRDAFARMYMDTFTEKEIRDLIEFYSTETGKKAIKTLPELTQKGAIWGQETVMNNIEELQLMIQEEAERLQKLKDANQ